MSQARCLWLAVMVGLAPLCCASAAEKPTLSLADLIEQTEPSCVRIDVEGSAGQGIGSGFVMRRGNWVVTNYHVVAGARKATVKFADEKEMEVVGFLAFDAKRDVAVLQLKADSKRTPLILAEKSPRKGESVVAIGAPRGLSFTATAGIVSAIRDGGELAEFGLTAVGTWLQMSTPISPGSSGGPLLNMQGEVVGANTASLAGSQNLNFATASSEIQAILDEAAKSKLRELKEIPADRTPPRRPPMRPTRPPSGTDEPAEPVVAKMPVPRRFSHRIKIEQEEDEFDKITWLRTEWLPLRHNDPRLASVGLRVSIPYGEDAPPLAVLWEIGATAKSFVFLTTESRRFQMLIDSDSVEWTEPQHKGEIRPGGVSERLTKLLRLDYFSQLVLAKDAKGRIGTLTYELTADQMECLRDLASRIPLGEALDGQLRVVRASVEEDHSIPSSQRRRLLEQERRENGEAEPQAPEKPEVAKPEIKKPEVAKPEIKKPEIAKPEMAKPEVAKPGVPQPLVPKPGVRGATVRTWTSADGKFSIEAEFIREANGLVYLRRRDNGQEVAVPLNRLSPADAAYVRGLK